MSSTRSAYVRARRWPSIWAWCLSYLLRCSPAHGSGRDREHIGSDRTPVVHTWLQTETGMILITPMPGVTTVKPGSATKPFPGVEAAVYDESGKEVGPGGGGYLVLRRPWPAMLRGIFKDDQRYRETYWSKYPDVYFAGDGARIDEDGDFWLMGRVD